MSLSNNPSEKLILALDGMEKDEVFSLISKLPKLIWVKVGLELFVNSGPVIIKELTDCGKKVFLDLKFHDIPTTMANSCRQAARTGASLITVHACAGKEALKLSNAAVIEGAGDVGLPTPNLLAVTVLTSWDSNAFSNELHIYEKLSLRVETLVQLAKSAGIKGCICSPQELIKLRVKYPEPFQLITPGIRLKDDKLNDQVRVMSPLKALRNGASKLVIGRSVTQSQDPINAFNSFYDEINSN